MNKRCFIFGNSPSLLEENLKLIENEDVFICNRGYKIKEVENVNLNNLKYYVLGDKLHAETFLDEIYEKTKGLKIYLASNITDPKVLKKFESIYEVYKRIDKPFSDFPLTFNQGWGKGKTVIVDAIIIAYFLGYKEIYLLGVDLDYSYTNNHFYKDSSFEIKYKNNVPKSLKQILKSLDIISKYFDSKNIKFRNLSKRFKHIDYVKKSKLESVIK